MPLEPHAGRILYVQYTNPAAYPPLEHSAHLFADAGFEVMMLGTDILGSALVLESHPRLRVLLKHFRGGGWRQKLHYASFAWSVASLTFRWRPDWIYASDPLSAPLALVAQALTGARVIYHEHDSPAPADEPSRPSGFMRLVIGARRVLARRADLCILPNARRADEFSRATGRRDVLTVWNCPMPQDVAEAKAVPATGLRVLYHGSIVPSRLPLAVVEAMATLPASVSLAIAGYETAGHQGHVTALLNRAAALGIADRVTYAGTLPRRADLMAQCAGCDVGLALMPLTSPDLNERAMVGASNKPFDYMAGGLALLVSDLPDWHATFEDPGYALSCDPASAASVASRLRWFLEHPGARLEMGERGRRRIADDWNYRRVFAGVLEHVSRRPENASRSITSVQSRA